MIEPYQIARLLTEDPDIVHEWVPDDGVDYRERLLVESGQSEKGPKCAKCGMWYVGDKKHDCNPRVPITAHFSMDFYDLSRKVDNFLIKKFGIEFDTGASAEERDWQFEMYPPADRLKVVYALQKAKIPFKVRTQENKEMHSFKQ